MIGGLEGISRHAELPLRPSELGVHRRHGLDRAIALAIKIPPARAPIRYEIEVAARRPFRLKNRFTGSARDLSRMLDLAIGREIADPEFRRHPRHVRVIPAQPRETVSIRAKPRRRIKIGARNKGALRARAREVDADKRVDHLPVTDMVFSDADQAVAASVDDAIGIAQGVGRARGRRWCDRPRLTATVLAIESLIRVVGEKDDAIANRERPAAVS